MLPGATLPQNSAARAAQIVAKAQVIASQLLVGFSDDRRFFVQLLVLLVFFVLVIIIVGVAAASCYRP
jgi:hypothetical protein